MRTPVEELQAQIDQLRAQLADAYRFEVLNTVAWTDYSATSTVVGWSSYTTKKIYYKKIGRLVFVKFYLAGTSDATSITFTLPFTQVNDGFKASVLVQSYDNGVAGTGLCDLAHNDNVVHCYQNTDGAAWTNSGTKLVVGQFWFDATA